jgi:phosphate transport system substrate-binding protein
MKRFVLLFAMSIFGAAGNLCAEERLVVGGSGGIYDEVKEIAKIYQTKEPSYQIDVMAESMATGATLDALKAGRLTLGLVGGSLVDDDKGKFAYRPIGRVPLGIGVNKALPVGNLSEAQVCDIFAGKIKLWREVGGAEGKIMVLTVIKKNDTLMESMRKHMGCLKDLNLTPDAIALNRALELQDAINVRPTTVGVVSVTSNMNEIRPNVKAVALNGVAATFETAQSGKYKYLHEYGAVTIGESHGAAKRFLDFAAGPEGQKVFAQRGLIAAR